MVQVAKAVPAELAIGAREWSEMNIHINPEIGVEFIRLADGNEADLTGDPDATCNYLYFQARAIGYDGGSPGMYGTFHIGDDGYAVALHHHGTPWENTTPLRTEHRVTECADCLFKAVQVLVEQAV
ncbi:hypothetical protein [Rhodococcus sp. WAY2]|uniref:hypothetical protein n=1 Tax=Rhodococcus sp. WAY2 TaxID=2663121 RepID=UPI00131FF102|nr:hypothetical protein [Rhodococcus sp. WAY2]QHE73525.1 hypothetical protein GFS60_07185 [Rhodococcus sp. WAY2]